MIELFPYHKYICTENQKKKKEIKNIFLLSLSINHQTPFVKHHLFGMIHSAPFTKVIFLCKQ